MANSQSKKSKGSASGEIEAILTETSQITSPLQCTSTGFPSLVDENTKSCTSRVTSDEELVGTHASYSWSLAWI